MTKLPPFTRKPLWLGCMSAWWPARRVLAPCEGLFRVFLGGHLAAAEYFGG